MERNKHANTNQRKLRDYFNIRQNRFLKKIILSG